MKALTYLVLPPDNRKAPGDTVTKKELEDADQTQEDIDKLIKSGAIGDGPDTPLHKDHRPIEIKTNTTSEINVVESEVVIGSDNT